MSHQLRKIVQMIGLDGAPAWVYFPSESADAKNANAQDFKKDIGNFIRTRHDEALT